jgi:hypothetical protein
MRALLWQILMLVTLHIRIIMLIMLGGICARGPLRQRIPRFSVGTSLTSYNNYITKNISNLGLQKNFTQFWRQISEQYSTFNVLWSSCPSVCPLKWTGRYWIIVGPLSEFLLENFDRKLRLYIRHQIYRIGQSAHKYLNTLLLTH